MECPRRGLQLTTDPSCPALCVKVVLNHIVEPFLRQVDSTKHIHRSGCAAGSVSVTTLDRALDLPRLEPDAKVEVKDREVIKGYVAIPPTENIHVLLIDYS